MVKKVVTAAMFMAVLSASALSIRQLRTGSASVTACGSPCDKTITTCAKPCYCFVVSGTTGFCQPEGPPPPPDLRK